MKRRRLARAILLQILFAIDLGGSEPQEAMEGILSSLDAERLGLIGSSEDSGETNPQGIRTKMKEVTEARRDPEFLKFMKDSLTGILEHRSELEALIARRARNWRLDRIGRVEKFILLMALHEMFYRDDIPFNVSINEAVELAKIYGDAESGKFVNGILGEINPDEVKNR